MWLRLSFPFAVHFMLIKPMLSDHLSYVALFWCVLGGSYKTGFTIFFFYLQDLLLDTESIKYNLNWWDEHRYQRDIWVKGHSWCRNKNSSVIKVEQN